MPSSVVSKRSVMANKVAVRHYRWFSEGKKDGLCGIMKAPHEIPRMFRESYNNGHTYGMLIREEQVA